jgi:serine/threonine protein kinase
VNGLPPPPLSEVFIDSPDTPRHFHIAQKAGLAARDRFEQLQRTSRLTQTKDNLVNNSAITKDDLLLLTWDDVCLEELLGVGGFACVCLATCPKLWKTHKRQYLLNKFNTSGDLASVDSSLLPPSEDSWMATSTNASNASTAETNAEKYYACKCLSKQTIQMGCQDQDQQSSKYVNAAADLVGEAFLLSKLEHPNIVRLYGVTAGAVDQAFLHKGGFFLIMEALNSVLADMIQIWRKDAVRSVGDFLRKSIEAVPCIQERLAIALEIAKGMDYLHSKRIIFRDLKPANVGIDRDGGLRLFDFGLARECPSGICAGKAGSRRYMAPETIANKVTCFASDVYSFGITLWELVSLVRPVHFDNPEDFERAVCLDDFRPPIHVIEDTAIRNLIESCWRRDYQKRPTFSQIIDSIQQILRVSDQGNWIHTKAGADVLDGCSFHLNGISRHSKTGDTSSYRSLMEDSFMTDGSQSRVSALTMESSRSSRTGSSSSMPSSSRSITKSGADKDKPTRSTPPRAPTRRPPKGPREQQPCKNESETTVNISNTAQNVLLRKQASYDECDTEMKDRMNAPITPTISNGLSRKLGRPARGPRDRQKTKTESLTTTVSAPEKLMTPQSTRSFSSNGSNQSNGTAIQWQRRKRQSESPRERQVRRAHSEPLSSFMATQKKK